jgi:hypothetical protein
VPTSPSPATGTDRTDPEERAAAAEAALEEALRERAELWARVNELRAQDREVQDLRAEVAYLRGTISWRITRPLRLLRRRR